jgi:hypothetical protein
LLIALLLTVWTERNKGNHGEKRMSVKQFQFSVRQHVDDWKKFLNIQKQPTIPSNRQWSGPAPDFVKINVDASFRHDTRDGGWGAICRDSSSDFCFAAA